MMDQFFPKRLAQTTFNIGRAFSIRFNRIVFVIGLGLLSYSYHGQAQNIPNSQTGPLSATQTALARPTYTTSGMKVSFVRSYQARIAGVNGASLDGLSKEQVMVSTQYLDGLGRPIQTVLKRASAQGNDIVQPIYYDEFGKSQASYLAYSPSSTTDGDFKTNPFNAQYTFHTNKSNVSHQDTNFFYGYSELEKSGRNRSLSKAGPGQAFVGRNVKATTTMSYNTSTNIRVWTIGTFLSSAPTSTQTYSAGELLITQTQDEENTIRLQYHDREGRLQLERVQKASGNSNLNTASHWLSTYYVYDEQGRLRVVIPPAAEEYLRTNNYWAMGTSTIRNMVAKYWFFYFYDERDRLIVKKLPGITDLLGGIEYVYDKRDRLIMTQTGTQRAQNRWTFMKYDGLDRLIKVGEITNSQTRSANQSQANSNPAWPTTSSTDEEIRYYYDDYDFDNDGIADESFNTSFNTKFAQTPQVSMQVYGMATGVETRVLGTTTFNKEVMFYDEMGRLLQQQSVHHLGGTQYTTYQYDFVGNLLRSYQAMNQPQADIGASFTLQEDYIYDHQDRLLTVHHRINDGTSVKILEQSYDALGQLTSKELGDGLQTIDYRYNVRGWLTHINDADRSDSDDLFGMELYYDYGYSQAQKNGNIAGVRWQTATDEVKRSYGFRYDVPQRLNHADYRAHNGSNWTSLESGRYSVNNIAYDANGNITALQRQGLLNSTGTPSYGQIDNLSYTYDGNRLKTVNDGVSLANGVGDFKSRSTAATQFTYDGNGNLQTDLNKEISHIRYNRLNLPDSIRKSDGNSISYRYDAQGNKLSQRVWSGSTLQHTRHYLGNYFYENDTLQQIQFGDGRIVYNPAEYGYEYHYYHKDHLGNIRQVFRAESTTTYMATMEPENETQEMQQYFHNLSDSRSIDARYNQTEGGRAVAYLDASRGRDYGPVWSKELAQGDSLHAAVLGMLYDPKEKPKMRDLLLGMGKQNSLLTSGELTSMTGTSSLGLQPLWLALQLARQLEKAPLPESYLGYILYDQDSIRYDSGRVEISRQAFTNPEELALDITATQGGFVEVYVYNASASPVWYDQFSISSSQAVIIQENHYYPFGMQIAGLELDLGSKNRYLYNGKELQDDHDLDWHDYGARMYDAQIGRWHVVDPMADSYLSFSPYNYTLNNPLSNIDPNGMWVSTFQIAQFLAQQTDPDRRSDEGSSFIQSVSRGFKNFFGKLFSPPSNEDEATEQEAYYRGLEEVSNDVEALADAQAEVIDYLPGGFALNGLMDYKFGKFDQDEFLAEAGAEILFGKAGGLIFTKIGAKVVGKNFNKISDDLLKKSGIDAHQLKRDFLGTKAKVSRYDLYKDTKTGEILILQKGGKGTPIQTGEFIK
ncbi:DUF6443 domain-containing protein [Peijinzhouia sedimentorum]